MELPVDQAEVAFGIKAQGVNMGGPGEALTDGNPKVFDGRDFRNGGIIYCKLDPGTMLFPRENKEVCLLRVEEKASLLDPGRDGIYIRLEIRHIKAAGDGLEQQDIIGVKLEFGRGRKRNRAKQVKVDQEKKGAQYRALRDARCYDS